MKIIEVAVYYYDIQIATSLEEFLSKIEENDKYYLDLLADLIKMKKEAFQKFFTLH